MGISRQGVHDNLSRTEALLRNMETKTGCVERDRACRKAIATILHAAKELQNHEDPRVSALVAEILCAAQMIKE